MREAHFIKQNKDNWLKFERALTENKPISPDELSRLYLQVSDHLSYSQTFYPGSNTSTYLNALASKAHQKIYRNKKESRNKLIRFFTQDFPKEFYVYRFQFYLSFFLFLIFAAIGAFSSATDAGFVRVIMGDAYVNMTMENIANNDPMAVYKQMNEMDMFLGITINNIRVALYAFVFGILLGIGSVFIIMQNAVMLGSFQYFFYDQGLFWESARTIWIHGTIEIFVIIVAASAGLVVGKSILFPGTYTRLASFIRGVKVGLKIVLSTVPFFIIAGFLEGFVTRQTQMSDSLAILIIGASLILMLFYYVYLPFRLNNKPSNG